MAKTWFPHEEGLKEGEENKPLFGPRFSPFWFFAFFFMIVGLIFSAWLSCSFIFSHPVS
ncbi:MAG: hypothetical protein V4498_10270 [candidate division FCPU426 bacterium]